jgi:hypothetical protein
MNSSQADHKIEQKTAAPARIIKYRDRFTCITLSRGQFCMITDEKTYLQVKFSINYVHKRLVEPLDKKLAIVDVMCLL